eukprot:5219412-Amphidinium_carterae.1
MVWLASGNLLNSTGPSTWLASPGSEYKDDLEGEAVQQQIGVRLGVSHGMATPRAGHIRSRRWP